MIYSSSVWLALSVPDVALSKAVKYLKTIPLTLENSEELRELVRVLEKPLLDTDKERFLRRVISRDYRSDDPRLLIALEKASAECGNNPESRKAVVP